VLRWRGLIRRAARAWILIAASSGLATACSLLVDTSDLAGEPVNDGGGLEASDVASPALDGPPPDGPAADAPSEAGITRVSDGLVALFLFRETEGTVVHDVAPGGDDLELSVTRAPAPDNDGGVRDAATSGPTISWMNPGMQVEGRVLISAPAAPAIRSRCNASGEITVEAWIRPLNTTQAGPVRIVTMSNTGFVPARNFTLGQQAGNYIFRLRTNGSVTEYPSSGGVRTTLTHVVVTARRDQEVTFSIDGVRNVAPIAPGAIDFIDYPFALANENEGFTIDRLWRGDYRLVAVYCRALSEAEIARNRSVGPTPP
jgi:hypothetical protein